jgi:hypothetical protein
VATLRRRAEFDVPLDEVSGLCVRRHDGGDVLVAIGDDRGVAVVADIGPDGPGPWREVDLPTRSGGRIPARDCQAEAVAADAAGAVVVVLEEPARLVVVGDDGTACDIELVVPADHPLSPAWEAEPNSRGEGLVLLSEGHVLVVKEKRPSALLEFGPPGDAPTLPAASLPGPADHWSAPTADTSYTLLATWPVHDDLAERVGDLSDATVDHRGRLVLLSDQSSRIVVADPLGPPGTPVTAAAVLRIEHTPDKAEGLAVLADGTVLVALDLPRERKNLLVLEVLPEP